MIIEKIENKLKITTYQSTKNTYWLMKLQQCFMVKEAAQNSEQAAKEAFSGNSLGSKFTLQSNIDSKDIVNQIRYN